MCPVYQQVGGHAYGSVYPGPIGAVITPQLSGMGHAAQLPYASSLCGACKDVCPVKIDIPALLLHLRSQIAEGPQQTVETSGEPSAGLRPPVERVAFRMYRITMQSPYLYRAAMASARGAQRIARAMLGPTWANRIGKLVPPLGAWTNGRDIRPLAPRSFRNMWDASTADTNETHVGR